MASKRMPGTGGGGDGRSADTPRRPDELSRNPGVGSSQALHSRTATNPEALEGGNASEGGVMDDTTAQGSVLPRRVAPAGRPDRGGAASCAPGQEGAPWGSC